MRPSAILSSIFSGLPSARTRSRWISHFFGDESGGQLVAADDVRMSGGDLHSEVAHERFEFVFGGGFRLAGGDFKQHANLRAGVNVVADKTTAGHFVDGEARDNDVFAELGDFGFDHFADSVRRSLPNF